MKKNNTPIEYIFLSENTPYLALKRKQPTDDTVDCPFCGANHSHGISDGHRVPHCETGEYLESVTAPDGIILYQKDGYVVVSETNTPLSDMVYAFRPDFNADDESEVKDICLSLSNDAKLIEWVEKATHEQRIAMLKENGFEFEFVED